jgi:transcriptional regulator with AAA-type ATPase domain
MSGLLGFQRVKRTYSDGSLLSRYHPVAMALPRILVFDDMAGWLRDYRARLCQRLLLRDVTDGVSRDAEDSVLAEAVFHPAQTRKGNHIANSIDEALNVVRKGVDGPKEHRWALVLLDLQFDYGEVADGELNPDNNWPRDADPQFGLRLLENFAKTWPDPQRPGRTSIPVAALSHSRKVEVEGALNNLGNLGYLQSSDEKTAQLTQRRRLSDLLFHFGLFADGAVSVVGDNGQLRKLTRNSRILGDSVPLLHALREARQAAASPAPCLLQGLTGSGKGEFAKLIHELSPRRDGPFRQRDCASLPETLLEVELFGYVPKAALENQNPKGKRGDFEIAQNGTLFLDEIGEMPPVNQAKLLVTLQEGRVSRLGAEEGTPVDVRVLAATNVDLEEAVKNHEFNEALYSRLHSLKVRVPALDERRDDIPVLFQNFVERATKDIGGETSKVYPDETLEILRNKDWRFNVRELENLAKKIAVERKYSKVIAPNDVG